MTHRLDYNQIAPSGAKALGSVYGYVLQSSLPPVLVEYGPGGFSAGHTHAKSAFIYAYVVSGAIESQVNDGAKRVYRAGESFFEEPGSTHPVSRNASKTRPAKLLAVFVVDSDESRLTTPLQ